MEHVLAKAQSDRRKESGQPDMMRTERIESILRQLRGISPAGFAIALHVKYTSPRYLFQAYEKEWLDEYSRRGFVLVDPTIPWAFGNSGTIRWSELRHADTAGLFDQAAGYGLAYGVTVGVQRDGSHSMASFSRGDREFSAAEAAASEGFMKELHDLTRTAKFLTPQLHETLRQLSVYLTRG